MQLRIDRLLKSLNKDGCVLISSYYNIFYYSGFTSEDAYLLITNSKKFIITDSRYFVQARLESPDFELIDIAKGWRYIFESICEDRIFFEEKHLTYGSYKFISQKAEFKEFIPSQTEIDKPRQIKDEYELKTIAEAERIGDMAFSHILDILHPGMSEGEVALELEMYMRKQGATALSFDTIAASGVRSAMPHGVASDKIIEKGDLLTLDFGCIYKGYCSDMTRTVVIGTPDEKQKEIYEIVLKAQTEALLALKQGIECKEIDAVARKVIADSGYGANFGHALGHSVGIQIHETPVFSPKSKDILQNGNVLSVEPGIYIDGWGGVRIEDLIAVFNGEIITLTNSPKELIVI